MIPIILKPILHFITSGVFGLILYLIFIKLFNKLRNKEECAFLFSLFNSILLHVIIDYGPGWF
ncbi:hypothetical protein J4455_02940 [Candidatus Woesearchaeota archaeon]|nr:hypothetical protein [Candidatus Woesearchaeota archaeon]